MSDRDFADLTQSDRHAELGLVNRLAGGLSTVRDEIHLKAHRAGRECIRDCIAVPIAGAGISEVERFVSDGASVIVRRIPDLAHGNGSKPAGKSRIGKTSARLAAISGADFVLEAVHCGQPVGDLRRALDAPARAAVKELAVSAAADMQSAAQRAIPTCLGKNNGGYTQFFSRK